MKLQTYFLLRTALYEIAFINIDVVIFWNHSFSLILPNYYSSLLDLLLDKPVLLLFWQPYYLSPLTSVITILCSWYVRGGILVTVCQLLSQAVRTSYLLLNYFAFSSTFVFEKILSMHLFNFWGYRWSSWWYVSGFSGDFIHIFELFYFSNRILLAPAWQTDGIYDLLTVVLNLDNQAVTSNSLPLADHLYYHSSVSILFCYSGLPCSLYTTCCCLPTLP